MGQGEGAKVWEWSWGLGQGAVGFSGGGGGLEIDTFQELMVELHSIQFQSIPLHCMFYPVPWKPVLFYTVLTTYEYPLT